MRIEPQAVHETLARTLLVDGYPYVLDIEKSHGSYIHDALSGDDLLDFFTFYASRPLAFNHPKLKEPEQLARVAAASTLKPSNGDMYTTFYAEFAETFRQHALGPGMSHMFFVDGGALAVENALKAAFDWKARLNMKNGKGENPGRVLHFQKAFHGRSGYTLSLTNTADPRKTQYFPKFDWPRVSSPAMRFPMDAANLEATQQAEAETLAEIDAIYQELGAEEIACILIEPIQCEGGDRHFRPEFFQALRKICDERDALLIFDEVQTGFGATGTMWMYEQLGVTPDVVAFSKKSQTGGIMATDRIDDVDSVFKVSSRISSTFGGNLSDYLRCQRVLEIMQEDGLLENVKARGQQLLEGVKEIVAKHDALDNARGLGLLIAFDAETPEMRKAILERAAEHKLLILPCGTHSVRLRPALDVTAEEAEQGLTRLAQAVSEVVG